MRTLLLVSTLLSSLACASIPHASANLDAEAKRFASPPPGKAAVYVFRPSRMVGVAVALSVLVNGQHVGATASCTYLYLPIEPGPTIISTLTGENLSKVEFVAHADSTYFVHQEARMGLGTARAQLTVVGAQEGRLGVERCQRVESQSVSKP